MQPQLFRHVPHQQFQFFQIRTRLSHGVRQSRNRSLQQIPHRAKLQIRLPVPRNLQRGGDQIHVRLPADQPQELFISGKILDQGHSTHCRPLTSNRGFDTATIGRRLFSSDV